MGYQSKHTDLSQGALMNSSEQSRRDTDKFHAGHLAALFPDVAAGEGGTVLAACVHRQPCGRVGHRLATAQHYPPQIAERLAELVAAKMAYREIGGVTGWVQLVLSGMLANWLVGLAALFATMGRTAADKFVPLFLAVSLFVGAGFQHSPANMAYFSRAAAAGIGPGWVPALAWNIPPAALGNLLGSFLFVVVPFWVVFGSSHDQMSDG